MHAYATQWSTVELRCTQMTLAISMLKNILLLQLKRKHMTLAISTLKSIFPLHLKMQDHHLKYPNVLFYMS